MTIVEGIWSKAKEPDDWKKLARLLYAPEKKITPAEMRDRIYDLYGDDDLFDMLDELESDNPDVDAGPYVIGWLEKNRPSDLNSIWQIGHAGRLGEDASEEGVGGEESMNELQASDIESILALVLERLEEEVESQSSRPEFKFDEFDHVEEAIETIKQYMDSNVTPVRPTEAGLALLDTFVEMIVDEDMVFDFNDPESIADDINTSLHYDRMDLGESLRHVRVTFDDGNVIDTNMAAGLSDEEIKDYYAIGKEFNVGDGEHDKMARVSDVEILEAAPIAGAIAGGLARGVASGVVGSAMKNRSKSEGVLGAIGGGLVGGAALGPVGAVGGAMLGHALTDELEFDDDIDEYLEVDEDTIQNGYGQHHVADDEEINGFPPRAHSSSVKGRKFGLRGDNILDETFKEFEEKYKSFFKK